MVTAIMTDKPVIHPIEHNEHAVGLVMRFKRCAKEQGCDTEQASKVIEAAKSATYDDLVATITANSIFCE